MSVPTPIATRHPQTLRCVTLSAALLALGACGDDSSPADRDATTPADDAGVGDGSVGDGGSNSGDFEDKTAVAAPAELDDPDLVGEHGRLRLLPRAVARQADALLIAGDCGGDLCVTRLSVEGQVDPSFGTHGVARIDAGGMRGSIPFLDAHLDGAFAVLAHEAHVYLAGYAWAPAGAMSHALVVARLDADGELDASFGQAGLKVIDFVPNELSNPAHFGALFVDAAGLPYGIGTIQQAGATTDILAVRLTAQGTTDATYATGSEVLQRAGNQAGLFVVESGDGIVVGGHSVFARLDATGKLDTSFGDQGYVVVGDELAQALVTRDDESLLAAGFTKDESSEALRRRLRLLQTDAAGKLDEKVGPKGETFVDYDLTTLQLDNGERLSGAFGLIRGMQSLEDGGLLVYGGYVAGIGHYPTLLRLDAQLKPVESFGSRGILTAPHGLPLFASIQGLEPPSRLLVADDSFFVVDFRIHEQGNYLSLWSGKL